MAGHCRSTQWIALRGVLVLLALLLPTPALAQTRVACVGDSITYGYGLSNRDTEAYPFVLQELLGAEFEVGNFGDSGSTLQESGDKPWRAQAAHAQCLAFTPNIVVIMLGTNDAKPNNWSEAGFVSDYHALIAEFRDLGAQVYVATPPAVIAPGAFEIQPAVVNDELVPLVRQIASDANAPLIDVYIAFEDQPALLPDTVHPNAAGARLIAERVAAALLAADDTTNSLQTTGTSTTLTSGSGGTSASALTATTTQGAGGQGAATDTTGTGQGATTATTGQMSAQSASAQSASATSAGGAPSASSQTTGLTSSTSATSTGTPSGNAAGGGEGGAASHSADEQGCSCGVPAAPSSARASWLLLAVVLVSRRRR